MSANVTETDAFSADVPTPVLGDKFTYPGTVTDALTKLASRTLHLSNTLNGQTGSTDTLNNANTGVFDAGNFTVPLTTRGNVIYQLAYQLVSTIRYVRRSVWGITGIAGSAMQVPIAPTAESDGGATLVLPGTNWGPTGASDYLTWQQLTTPTAAPRLWFPIRGLPPAGKIKTFSYRAQGGAGHGGTLPGTMPQLSLLKRLSGSAAAVINTTVDPSASAGAYEAEHAVFSVAFDEVIQTDCEYFFRFEGEAGSNKQDLLKLVSCNVTIDPP